VERGENRRECIWGKRNRILMSLVYIGSNDSCYGEKKGREGVFVSGREKQALAVPGRRRTCPGQSEEFVVVRYSEGHLRSKEGGKKRLRFLRGRPREKKNIGNSAAVGILPSLPREEKLSSTVVLRSRKAEGGDSTPAKS